MKLVFSSGVTLFFVLLIFLIFTTKTQSSQRIYFKKKLCELCVFVVKNHLRILSNHVVANRIEANRPKTESQHTVENLEFMHTCNNA